MKKEEFHEKHSVRIVLSLLCGALIFCYAPSLVDVNAVPSVLKPSILVVLFVFLTSFLVSQALDRWRAVVSAVRMELSRLRRIVHLSGRVGGQAKWKKDVRASAMAYLKSVARHPIRQYERSHKTFRVFTSHVYGFKPKTARDQILFDELLDVARDVAFQRTAIENYLRTGLPNYAWTILSIVAVVTVALLAVSHQGDVLSRLYASGACTGILLLLDLLFETDRLTHRDRHQLKEQYRTNLQDLKQL